MSKLEAVVFQNSRAQNLVGVMHHGKGEVPRPCLVVCHGFAGTKIGGSRRFVEFARYAVEKNLSVFRFDFAGSGDSDGNLEDLTLDDELDDLHAAITTVSKMDGVDPQKIGVVGHCMGAVTAIRGSARDSRIYKTVTWAPFSDLEGTMERLVGEEAFQVLKDGEKAEFLYNEQLFCCGPRILTTSYNINMYEEISNVQQPLLVIHGTEDATVPLSEVEKMMKFAEQSLGEKRLIILEGAHHSFPYHKEELFDLTVKWFKESGSTNKKGERPMSTQLKVERTSNLFEEFCAAVAQRLNIQREKLYPDALWVKDVGITSVDIVKIVMLIRQKFGVKVATTQAGKIKTVQDTFQLISGEVNVYETNHVSS